MKQITKSVLLALIATSTFLTTSAQTAQNGAVVITGTKFTYPLVNEWIAGFKAEHPEITVRILQKNSNPADSANLFISAHAIDNSEIRPGYKLVKIARYAILPVTNQNNPWLTKVLATGIDKKKIKSVFFNKNYDAIASDKDQEKEVKNDFAVNLYTREQKGCAPIAFANYYEFKQENINGTHVLGDDKGLLAAISKDSIGLTYNNPGYIYDLKTRKVQSPLAVVPIDQNGNGKLDDNEKIYDNLDNLLAAIESNKTKQIPIEYVTIAVPEKITSENNNLKLFTDYITNEGQKNNKQYGFLGLLPDDVQKQKLNSQASIGLK